MKIKMPCNICNSLLIRKDGKIICPNCKKIPLLDRNTTVEILQKNLDDVEFALLNLITMTVDKTKILDELMWQRERFSRDFFDVYKEFDLINFLTLNLLIFKLMKLDFKGKRLPTDAEFEDMLKAFSKYQRMKAEFLLLKNGFAVAIKSNGKIQTFPNERYFPIEKSYEDNLILTGDKASNVLVQFRRIFNLLYKNDPRSFLHYTPEEFIQRNYSVINQFYCTLLRNEVFDEVFGLLNKYCELEISPGKLMDFVNSYPFYLGTLCFTTLPEFIIHAKKHFAITETDVEASLLFGEENSVIFPLFVFVADAVSISHRTSYLIYVLLHALFYKDIFDKETEKRSKAFEILEVKKKFESIGWQYFPNLKHTKKPILEIDGIATFERKMLVIECKGWRPIRPFYEYENVQEQLIRDIKGIVDGQKFTGEIPTKIPRLLDKLSFVETKMNNLDFNPTDYDTIKGLIIIRGFPPITRYRGVDILSINEIEDKFRKETTNRTRERPEI